MAGVALLSRSTRPCESMHGHARTFSEHVIASIIDDSRCMMSDVAFRTAPPIGGFLAVFAASPVSNQWWTSC